MRDRTEYFRAYAKANAAKRKEANRRWREQDPAGYNAAQKARNERWRRAHGMKPRPEPKPITVPRAPKEKPKTKAKLDPIATTRSVETLRNRFLKWRANLP